MTLDTPACNIVLGAGHSWSHRRPPVPAALGTDIAGRVAAARSGPISFARSAENIRASGAPVGVQ